MKFALLGDLHLTDNPESIRFKTVDWALAEAARQKVDAVIGFGDLTATGTAAQTQLWYEHLKQLDLPFYSTVGNAELRSGDPAGPAGQNLPVPDDLPVFLLDTSTSQPDPKGLDLLAKLPADSGKLLVTHYPPKLWENSAQKVLEKAIARRAVTAVIAGHIHEDGDTTSRGLDPDKASGGPPQIVIFNWQSDRSWKKTALSQPGVDPMEWTLAERESLKNVLGVSCMLEPLETLKGAAALAIPVAELRFEALDNASPQLFAAVDLWRQHGGRILSLHLPNLRPDESRSDCELARGVEVALRLGVDRVTLHVPDVTAAEFPNAKNKLTENFLKLVSPLWEKGVTIGIENLHTRFEKWSDEQRNYGCTIKECSEWITHLRSVSGSDLIGFHLDIGHARNNVPFSQYEYVSDYFGVPALPIKGCHFHQICKLAENNFKNHILLESFYGKIIPLSSYFLARRAGIVPLDMPVILEINVPGGGLHCYRKFLQGLGSPVFDER